MSKKKWRKGPKITSLDELVEQEMIYFFDKPTHNGWFGSWQMRLAKSYIDRGMLYYALPEGRTTRFSDEDLIRARKRLLTIATYNGWNTLITVINAADKGHGDIDDVIDLYENSPAY